MITDTLDRNPPDLERRLAFNVRANELLGRTATPQEVEEMRLCYLNGWTPEDFVRVMVYRAAPSTSPQSVNKL